MNLRRSNFTPEPSRASVPVDHTNEKETISGELSAMIDSSFHEQGIFRDVLLRDSPIAFIHISRRNGRQLE